MLFRSCSDGSLSPKELIEKAHEIGLCAIAITDHDTVDGIEEFQNTAKLYPNLRAINGCELAVISFRSNWISTLYT